MKFIILIFCFTITSIAVLGQDQKLRVVHLYGEILADTVKKKLNIGDRITQEELVFIRNNKVKCLLFDGSNKYILKTSPYREVGKVNDLFSLSPNRQLIASRGTSDSSYLKLQDYFNGDSYLMLDSTEQIKINPSYIEDLGDYKFLFVNSDNKKSLLDFKNSVLTIDAKKIFSDTESKSHIEIFRVNPNTGEFVKEVAVDLQKMNKNEIDNKVEIIKEAFPVGLSIDEEIKLTYSILVDIYGGLNFAKWSTFYKENYSNN